VFILEDVDSITVQKISTFLKSFASEAYSEETCKRAIDNAILDYYKQDKSLLQNIVLKQRGKILLKSQ
jgi:hypothetical protein